jgi:hypothetical protein
LQLQTSRVFWILDFLAAIYLAWLFAEAPRSSNLRRAAVALAVAAAVGRGLFVWSSGACRQPIAQIGFPQDNWTDAMEWISRTPADSHVLADPGHAWKYGSSVRVTGERDVYLEEVKDLALALYSREVAVGGPAPHQRCSRLRLIHTRAAARARDALRSRLPRPSIATSTSPSRIATNSFASTR